MLMTLQAILGAAIYGVFLLPGLLIVWPIAMVRELMGR